MRIFPKIKNAEKPKIAESAFLYYNLPMRIFSRYYKSVLISVIFSLLQGVTAQEKTDFPPLEPLFVYENEGELSGEDIIRAALEFSLCKQDSEEGKTVLNQFSLLENEVTSENFLSLPEEQRAEKILTLMYEKLLKKYSFNQTYIDLMFQRGTYNCVSSSVLYYALAKSAGITVHGNETPNHAFCTVYLSDGRKIDVETTNPNGFNPGTKKNLGSSGNSQKYYVVPKKSYTNRKEVGERKFISLIGKNVTALFDEKKDYKTTVPLSAARIVFVGQTSESDEKSVRESFEIAATNYAVSLDRQKKSDLALDWMDAVENRWGNFWNPKYRKLYDDIAYNMAVNLTNKNMAERAQEIFDSKKEKISEKNRITIQTTIFYAYINEKTHKMSPDEAISFIHEMKNDENAKDKSVAAKLFSLEEYYWSEKSKPLAKAKKHLEAAAVMEEGLKYLPNSKNLKNIRIQHLNNYIVEVHNKFVDFYNKKDYENAEKIIKDAIAILPESGTLKQDLKMVQGKK